MRRIVTFMSVALVALLVQTTRAGDCGCQASAGDCGCCDPCGCGDGCGGKHCELKVGKKKIKVICYGCECDSVCLPDPSCKGCTHCENICKDGDCCGGCDCECGHKPLCKVRWTDWCPASCGKVYDRKKLVKYEAEKEVPDYKWVVVDCCKEGAVEAPKDKGGDKPPTPPVPTPVSTTKARRVPMKAAPKNARVGEEFPLTATEIKQIESQIQQTSLEVPAAKAPVAKTSVAKTPAKVAAKPVSKSVESKSQVPWSLFAK